MDQVGLVMPTSLCSGQISRRIADRLNERGATQGKVTRFVALPHTEGCGVSAGSAEAIYSRTVLGHLASPTVRFGLLLEHGCEKTHNDYFRNRLEEAGLDPARFGWASVQLDGGIESVVAKVEDWFTETLADAEDLEYEDVGPEALRLGLYASGPVSEEAARSLAEVTLAVVGSGGTVVVPERAALLSSPAYLQAVLGDRSVENTLAYGQAATESGLHVMEAPTDHWVETATGLGATGVEVMLAHVAGHPLAGAPYDPTPPGLLRSRDARKSTPKTSTCSSKVTHLDGRNRCSRPSRPSPRASTSRSYSRLATPTSSSPAVCSASRCSRYRASQPPSTGRIVPWT